METAKQGKVVEYKQKVSVGPSTSKKHMVSSAMAGFVSYTSTHPLERVKIMRQTSQPGYTERIGIGKSLRIMFQNEGVRGLFKGNLVNCAGGIPYNSFEFFFYELFKNNLFPGQTKEDMSYTNKFICGGLAGQATQASLNPLGVVKTVYMTD